MLPPAIARQGLKAIAGRRSQVRETCRGVQVAELTTANLDQIRRKTLRAFAGKNGFRDFVPEISDHGSLYRFVIHV